MPKQVCFVYYVGHVIFTATTQPPQPALKLALVEHLGHPPKWGGQTAIFMRLQTALTIQLSNKIFQRYKGT